MSELAKRLRDLVDDGIAPSDLDSAAGIVEISDELIEFVINRFSVKHIDEFTCPIHRRLALALNKFPSPPEVKP